ncbi:cardiolipin synthase [Peribacillus simplex]|uniref:Cardiolipin synthase n=2 Tax=Peribacillus simplex TaxID=1478 RepID=A0A223ENF1_9BACI|nr:cardiolipin synthase [Peribacillus simplex]ASS96772.1 cardiolipin synthase [Peribacillus simplex NBRC 15720 = DSM 1321]MEC1395812.1 cardiolipin synthase [Peribacillus simplex]MED3909861.1 cardiolipin synthase [Peribacillus simplex]TVX84053.1 cardiolipin synthase [Peribacillus simplex]
MEFTHVTSVLLGLVIILNILFATIVIFFERREASTTWAWLLVLYFLPVVGFILYLLFGTSLRHAHLFQWEDKKKIGIEEILDKQMEELSMDHFPFRNASSSNYRDLIYMHLRNNDAVLTEDNQVDIFTEGKNKFDQLFNDIEAAENHIHIQYYIIQRDGLGKRFIEALTKKANEGVKVRLLYDELGSRGMTKRFFREFRQAGGRVEAFFPSKLKFINLRLNFRNHRKLVIIDGKIGYVGGFNVGDEYLGLNPKFGFWRDTHLRIKGSAVKAIQTRFILDWNQASKHHDITYQPHYFPIVKPQGNIDMQIVTSGPDSEWEQIKNGYIKLISSAKKSILIQTPYFIPDASLLDALRIASLSGLDVKIMIPNKPDHLFVYWATTFNAGQLLRAGAKIYIYDNGFIHAKMIVVDEEVSSVGTANIDVRSFKLNFEVNAFIYDEGMAETLTRIFYKDVEVCRQLTIEDFEKRSKWIRFKESIARLVSPIL